MTEEEKKAWDKAEGYLNLALAFAIGFIVGLFSHVG